MSALDEHLKKHRQQIIDREEKTFREMLAAYAEVEKELKNSFDKLQREIEAALVNGETISPSWFYRQKRLKNLLAQVQEQIVRFGGKARKIVEREQRAAIEIAVRQANETFNLLTDNAPDVRDLGSTLNPRTVETAVGIMGDGSPIISYFEQQLAPLVAERIKSEVIKASAIGTDFKTISKRLSDAGGITKYRALSVARTEVNRVRRETTRQIYQENDDIIEGWEWVASKSSRTCPLCLAMDGRQFPLDEPFPQHINCRCSMLAVIIGLPRRPRTIGKDWFENQSDENKEKVLGKEAFLAYRQNNLTLDDFVAFRNDKRFGKSVTRKPLAKILADKSLSSPKRLTTPNNISVRFGTGTKQKLEKLTGRKLTKAEIGGMVGALDDAKIKVKDWGAGVFFDIEHPFIEHQQRILDLDFKDRLYIHNFYFRTSAAAPKGTGLKSFATQTIHAKKFGVEYIDTQAAGDYEKSQEEDRWNGYYSWARMGYNAKLTDEDLEKLPITFRHARDLNELMAIDGQAAWKIFGTGRLMVFDLSDDSTSWRVLKKYLQKYKYEIDF